MKHLHKGIPRIGFMALGILFAAFVVSPSVLAATAFIEYDVPTSNSQPIGITSGTDGNIWFTENGGNKVGKITTSGVITEYDIPTSGTGTWGITAGPDGNMWFTEGNAHKIGKITTGGAIT